LKTGVRFSDILEENVKIPENWRTEDGRESMTRSKLIESRKKEFHPDISYDLDGDGAISHKDLFLAK